VQSSTACTVETMRQLQYAQAALRALLTPKVSSALAVETICVLKELSVYNSVRLVRTSGHCGILSNEKADDAMSHSSFTDFQNEKWNAQQDETAERLRKYVKSFYILSKPLSCLVLLCIPLLVLKVCDNYITFLLKTWYNCRMIAWDVDSEPERSDM